MALALVEDPRVGGSIPPQTIEWRTSALVAHRRTLSPTNLCSGSEAKTEARRDQAEMSRADQTDYVRQTDCASKVQGNGHLAAQYTPLSAADTARSTPLIDGESNSRGVRTSRSTRLREPCALAALRRLESWPSRCVECAAGVFPRDVCSPRSRQCTAAFRLRIGSTPQDVRYACDSGQCETLQGQKNRVTSWTPLCGSSSSDK
jgi:hypothetical protein